MRWTHFTLLPVSALLVFFLDPYPQFDLFNPDEALRPAYIRLVGVAEDAQEVFAVEMRPSWMRQPDSVVAAGKLTGDTWHVTIGLTAGKWYKEVQIVTEDSVLFPDIWLWPGDTIVVSERGGGLQFGGNQGASYGFYYRHLPFASIDLGAGGYRGATRQEIDAALMERQRALVEEFEQSFAGTEDSRNVFRGLDRAVGKLYLSWASARMALLRESGAPEPLPEESLAFIYKIPSIVYGLDPESTALLDFVRDCYFSQIRNEEGPDVSDVVILQRTMDLIEERHVSSMRKGLELSVVDWIISNEYEEGYPLIRKWMQPRAGYHLPREYFSADLLTNLMDRVEGGRSAAHQQSKPATAHIP